MKPRVFVLKVATSGFHLTCLWKSCNNLVGFTVWRSAIWRRFTCTQKVWLFFVFSCTWQEDVAKIAKVLGVPRNVNPAQAITWLVGVTNYWTNFQKQFTSILPIFKRKNTLQILPRGNAHWTNSWIWIEMAWAYWPYMYSYNWLFSWQNKNLEGKSSSGLLFTAKILQEAM